MKRPRRHEEDDLQKAVCNHLRARKMPGTLFFAVPNGGKRNAREAGRMKAMGVTAGVSDLILFRNKMFFALELKAAKGRVSDAQDDFLWAFSEIGGHTFVAFGIDQALEILELWGFLRPAVWPA
jgi:hypothetical protein